MSPFEQLRAAIENGEVARVRDAIAAAPELVRSVDARGMTPLMHAASATSRTPETLQLLLEAGADVNRQTPEGYTALHCAVDVNFEANLNAREVIGVLAAAGADLSLRQHYGWTPLLRAIIEGTAVEVEALLDAGADPNDTLPGDTLPSFNAGRTALMAAISTSDSERKIAALLRAGADPSATGATSATFFDFAQQLEAQYAGREFGEHAKRCAEIARRWVGDA